MTDIVQRLREFHFQEIENGNEWTYWGEAAYEIEKLREQLWNCEQQVLRVERERDALSSAYDALSKTYDVLQKDCDIWRQKAIELGLELSEVQKK